MQKENDYSYYIAVSGWQEGSTVVLNDIINDYLEDGLQHILCTDVSRDGTMTGCNVVLYKYIQAKFPQIKVQASGGVSSLKDLEQIVLARESVQEALEIPLFECNEIQDWVTDPRRWSS